MFPGTVGAAALANKFRGAVANAEEQQKQIDQQTPVEPKTEADYVIPATLGGIKNIIETAKDVGREYGVISKPVIEKVIPVRSPKEVAEFYGIGQQPEQPQQVQQQAYQQPQEQQKPKAPVFRTIRDVVSYVPQTGDEYEQKRKILSSYKENRLASYQNQLLSEGADPDTVEKYMKLAENSLKFKGVVDLPEYDKTEEFKTVKEKFTAATEKQSDLVRKFGEAIKSAESALARGDRTAAFSIMQAELPKQINTLNTGESDAIQGPEFNRIALALQSVFNTPVSEWASIINGKGFSDAFKSSPEKFLEFAKIVHDGNVNVLDQKREFAESILGKRYARGVTGSIAGHERFNELENKDVDPKRQQVYEIINNPNLSKQTRDAARAKLTQLYGVK